MKLQFMPARSILPDSLLFGDLWMCKDKKALLKTRRDRNILLQYIYFSQSDRRTRISQRTKVAQWDYSVQEEFKTFDRKSRLIEGEARKFCNII